LEFSKDERICKAKKEKIIFPVKDTTIEIKIQEFLSNFIWSISLTNI